MDVLIQATCVLVVGFVVDEHTEQRGLPRGSCTQVQEHRAHSRCTPTPPILTPSVEAADISSEEILLSNSCSDREEGLSDTSAGGKHSPKVLLSEDNTESKLSANKHYIEKLW